MAKFVGSLMRDYLLFAISPTLLASCSHPAGREGAPVVVSGLLLSLLADDAAAARPAVPLPPVASRAERKQPVTLRISALNEPR
jgi:hypothetical protein